MVMAAAAEVEVEEKTEFTIMLEVPADKKDCHFKIVRSLTGLGLKS
jgi:ribosomal protein L7/L12